MCILGTLIGANLNDFLPPTVLVVLLLLLLSLTAYKTLQKGVSMYKKESQSLIKAAGVDEQQRLVVPDASLAYGSVVEVLNGASPTLSIGQQQHQLRMDIAKLTFLFVGITILNMIKGDPEHPGGLFGMQCDVDCFWLVEAIMVASIIVFSVWIRRNILFRLDSGVPLLSDIDWNEDNTVRYPIYAILAGLVAGLFGLGGGIVNGPLMLALGVHPAVASTTSACMILFTTATATISFAVFGLLIHDYAIAGFLIGFFASAVGQTGMSVLMQRYKRNSYIIFSIGIVVALSAVCMSVDSVLEILAQSNH
jgi:uncharacterized membrane protein YfcA